jgi:hypothetical protein
MRERLPALLACALALSVVGCGGGGTRSADVAQVRSVVTQFATADDAHACALLSPDALVHVYGGFRKSVGAARASCVRRSAGFKGEPVKITQVAVIDATTAHAIALNPAGDVTYTVTLRRFGPAWRIDGITQSKTEQ